jgi:energy-converting hydrogenase A subunit R
MICFDLEGPLSPQDNAYEVMKLAKNGGRVFEVLSEYDDILALRGKKGYEPGDTLKLIVPFLVYYGISEENIDGVSKDAKLVMGMKETLVWLKEKNQTVRIISTSYQQHAHRIANRLGVAKEWVASTELDLEGITFDEQISSSLKETESKILSEGLTDSTTKILDALYFESGFFNRMGVEVVGGQRKIKALLNFTKEAGVDLSSVAAIGDSITDFKMLREVSKRGGLSIAFNANKHCLPYADVGVATIDGRALIPILSEFIEGGREGAIHLAGELEKDLSNLEEGYGSLLNVNPRSNYSRIDNKSGNIDKILMVHRDMRMLVRGEAGKLG